jgi:hypothetical protein
LDGIPTKAAWEVAVIDFRDYRPCGRPAPDGTVARIVEGPLDEALVDRFDRLITLVFELGPDDPGADAVNAAAAEVGVALLGDRGLVDDVCAWLGDGPAEGDVLGALAGLYELGEIELGSAMRGDLIRAGLDVYRGE